MSEFPSRMLGLSAVVLALLGGTAFSAQDRYTVKSPHGLAFAEFKGYETWDIVGVSQNGDKIEVILGNPEMIKAFKAGIPDNGKVFPDGVRMAKIHWMAKKRADLPGEPVVPNGLHDVDLMVKDSKRFADGHGWGYAQFNYDAGTESFSPLQDDAKCGVACHNLAKARDYVFSEYPKR